MYAGWSELPALGGGDSAADLWSHMRKRGIKLAGAEEKYALTVLYEAVK